MYYIFVGIIILLAVLIAYGTWTRKKIYQQIDRFETWKIDVMNRPVTEEIARVKQLKMVGETEQKFENWRHEWDDIITVELPAVEEKLFDAEEQADRYRFKTAKQTIHSIQSILDATENRINLMLKELNKVVDSEEQNRKDIVNIKDTYHNLKKQLITTRSQFKDAITYLEGRLTEIGNNLKFYEEATENGNYVHAREILIQIKEDLDRIEGNMNQIPDQYKAIQVNIPAQLKEMQDGYNDMVSQGYVLEHLQFEQQCREINKHLQLFLQAIQKADIEKVAEGINEIYERIDWMYKQLEKEALSKKQLMGDSPTLKHDIFLIGKKISELKHETDIVQQSYRIENEDLQTQTDLNESFNKLEEEYNEVDGVINDKKQAYSIILEKMEDMRLHLSALRETADQFKEKIQTLRKDELVAKETIHSLREKLLDSRKMVQKGNLPGLPHAYITVLEEAEESLQEVNEKLEYKPLEMQSVNQVLQETLEKVDYCQQKTVEMVDAAVLSEKLIQYGNRYRSQFQSLADQLNKAESYFRSYNFEEALEIAAFAINQVDPGVLKRFDLTLDEIS